MAVPNTLRVDHAYGTVAADAEALTLGSIKGSIRSRNVELFHPPFEIHPRPLTRFQIGAIGTRANEQVPGQPPHPEQTRCLFGGICAFRHSLDDIAAVAPALLARV